MNNPSITLSSRNEELLKESHPLSSCFDQTDLWSPDTKTNTDLSSITDRASLEIALTQFKTTLLIPIELPAIYQSFQFAQKNDFKSIAQLDVDLKKQIPSPVFAQASQTVGRSQLKRLRPLKDHRLTQKYLESMEENHTIGWHTLVYGISLEIYSIPVRQGLANYVNRTLSTLLEHGGERVSLNQKELDKLFEKLISDIPTAIDKLLPEFSESSLRIT